MADGDDFAAMVEAELNVIRGAEEARRKANAAWLKANAAQLKAERERRELAEAEREEEHKRLATIREAEDAARAAERERQLKVQRQRLEAKRNPRAGTKPQLVWGEEVAQTCQQFLSFMKEREFSGATTLRHRATFRGWSIRGYGVGCIIFERTFRRIVPDAVEAEEVISRATPLKYNVFLCEDNLLRLFINASIGYRWDESHPPRVISDLWGDPMIGSFYNESVRVSATETRYSERSTGNPKAGYSVQRTPYRVTVDVDAHKARFRKCTIDQILVPYAVAAARGEVG